MLFFLVMYLVEGVSGHNRFAKDAGHGGAQTNRCTITWGSSAAGSHSLSMPNTNYWALHSAVVSDIDFDELNMAEDQFEVLRIDRLHHAFQWAECLENDWPELDLQWCLADWHDGKLIPDPL